jgi:DNA polymerase-3 subunit alpha
VNRRALESLIRAGALNPFGHRSQLLAVMDRMISISQQSNGAAQQYNMFGLPAFATSARLATDLPQVADIPRREVLGWEKELVGAYISDHPLSRAWSRLESAITVLSGELGETNAGHSVTVAGMVNYVRPIVTKKGNPMAFAQIEDLQGTIEAVIFPNIWEETRELWEPERILIVRGKVSLRGREPSIIVDSVTNEITTARPLEAEAAATLRKGPVHLHVSVTRGNDLERVIRHLGQVYEVLQRYEGEDRFSMYVQNGKEGRIQISFPNDTTKYCLELEQELRALIGSAAYRVEPRQ